MSLAFDAERVTNNARNSSVEDLLDRVTAYRNGLEPEALPILEAELFGRGITRDQIAEKIEQVRWQCVLRPDGNAYACVRCRRPAVAEGQEWFRLLRIVPLWKRRVKLCETHRSSKIASRGAATDTDGSRSAPSG